MTEPDDALGVPAIAHNKISPDAFTPRRPPRDMDPQACIEHGGHCWRRDPMVTASSPPIYAEYCKHCPAYRTGSPQEAIAWSAPKMPGDGW